METEKISDTDILNWLNLNPMVDFSFSNGYWRRTFGRKDSSNKFTHLRNAVIAAMCELKEDSRISYPDSLNLKINKKL